MLPPRDTLLMPRVLIDAPATPPIFSPFVYAPPPHYNEFCLLLPPAVITRYHVAKVNTDAARRRKIMSRVAEMRRSRQSSVV